MIEVALRRRWPRMADIWTKAANTCSGLRRGPWRSIRGHILEWERVAEWALDEDIFPPPSTLVLRYLGMLTARRSGCPALLSSARWSLT